MDVCVTLEALNGPFLMTLPSLKSAARNCVGQSFVHLCHRVNARHPFSRVLIADVIVCVQLECGSLLFICLFYGDGQP